MLRRLAPLVAILAVCQIYLASASGVTRRGLEIDKPTFTISNTVGFLQQDWRWYTIGLHPGTIHLTAHLYSAAQPLSPTYGLELILMRGRTFVAQQEVGCYRSQKHCKRTAYVVYKISQPGAYYILIIGLGANAISYRLHVKGPVYPLHCAKTC